MLKRLHLENVGPAPQLSLDFAPRLNLITGDNGLGKSFLLDVAWWATTRSWPDEPAWPDPSRGGKQSISFQSAESADLWGNREYVYDPDRQEWVGKSDQVGPLFGEPGSLGPCLYARSDRSILVFDAARVGWNREELPRVPLSTQFSSSDIWDGIELDDRPVANGLIRDWVTWQDRRSRQFEVLRQVLQTLSPDTDEVLEPGPSRRISLLDSREIPTLQMPYGNVPVTMASAGVQRILGLAYVLVWAWSEHQEASKLKHREPSKRVMVFVDEIEAHLHPRWQRTILPSLMTAALELEGVEELQIVVNTHSPLVLASAEPFFDPEQDALFHLDLVDGAVQLEREEWRPRGDASSWLTSDIFELGEARSIPAERAIEDALEAFRDPTTPPSKLKEIHERLHRLLKDTDPFWIRWLARAEAAGVDV